MKKRLLSILFTLALCLGLLSVTALAADTITVNGVDATNPAAVTEAFGAGKVSYDADTNTLTINGFLIGGTSISGNGTTDVEIIGKDGPAAAPGLTISGAKNVTITAEAPASTIIGAAEIACSGDVEITNNGTGAAVAETLTVKGAQNVTVSANSDSPAINNGANITCSGDVRITNNGSGAAVSGALTVNDAQNVTVSANSGHAAISGDSFAGFGAKITCSGDVEITNNGNGAAVSGALTVNGAQDVTVSANSDGPAISSDISAGFGAKITCSGDVSITNAGNGYAVGYTLFVHSARNVTVSANSRSCAINNGADITCSGNVKITNSNAFMGALAVQDSLTVNHAQDVTVSANGSQAVSKTLTVKDAQNVTVTANSNTAAAVNNASITCSGDVSITNNSTGMAVLQTLTVNGAQDVTVSANGVSPTIIGAADITCSGDVTLTNMGHGQVAANTLTVNGAQNVTVSANSGSPAISSPTVITCSGDVEITNSLGIALNSFLTVNGAKDVTISAGETASYPIDIAVYKATISCSGDVSITNSHGKINIKGLTVTGARNVTVSANSISSAAIYGDVSITCSGTVQLVNEGESKVIFTTLTFNQLNGDAYTVSSGSSLSDLTILRAQEAGTTFGPEAIDAKAVQIVPTHTPGEWEHNRTQHWQVCTACGAELDRADHTFIGRTCTVCGYTKPASTYAITVESAKNGDVTSSHKTASKGTTVTLTVTPDKGCTLETLTVTDASGSEIELANKGDGKYTFTMPASKVTVKATFMEDNSMLNFFVDVFPSDYYYDAVLWAAENGVTGGVDDTHFAPNAPCTRAQAVTFLWRAAGCPAPQSSEMPFTDVAEGSYYYDAVLWAVENGITKGTSDSAFSPDAACTRGQIVTFLWRSQSSPAAAGENSFTDVAADSYCADAVLWAVENGITKGTSDTTFSPDTTCTRAQIVTFLFRCLGGE